MDDNILFYGYAFSDKNGIFDAQVENINSF